MTAAKVVETSVTSTNRLSQDYTNLDDQFPQTCHDSPRFKPFTLICNQLPQKVILPTSSYWLSQEVKAFVSNR